MYWFLLRRMRCNVSARSLRGKVRGVPHAMLNFHNVASTKITVVSYGSKTRSVCLSVTWFKESENEVVKKFLIYLQFNEVVSNSEWSRMIWWECILNWRVYGRNRQWVGWGINRHVLWETNKTTKKLRTCLLIACYSRN